MLLRDKIFRLPKTAGRPARDSGSQSWPTSLHRRELPYGSPDFIAASELTRHLPGPFPVLPLAWRIVRNPATLRALTDIWRLPLVKLQARQADIEAWDTAYFNPAHSSRLAQAVLDLPTAEGSYLRGHSKQALRTNLRHARDAGITSARAPSYEVWCDAMSAILRARNAADATDWQYKPVPGQLVAYFVARDAEETPLACARVALFGAFGVLFWMISRQDLQPASSWARYQLHTRIVLDLGCSGNKHLLVASALKEAVGTQYFQHLLGYRARNLRVKVIG